MGWSSRTPAAVTSISNRDRDTRPTSTRQQAKSSSEFHLREFLYQSARTARASRRNSKPRPNSGVARRLAGETQITLSSFCIRDIATPGSFLTGGKAAAPRQYIAARHATPKRVHARINRPIARTVNIPTAGDRKRVTCIGSLPLSKEVVAMTAGNTNGPPPTPKSRINSRA